MNTCTFIILGATGDLATRRLIPALYEIIAKRQIDKALIIGAALEDSDAAAVLEKCKQHIPAIDQRAWSVLQKHFYYFQTDFSKPEQFGQLDAQVSKLEKKQSMPGNRIVYMAIPPQFFCPVTEQLSKAGIIKKEAEGAPWYRVVYEKPFGKDEKTAHEYNTCLAEYLDESQIFRIDHYLAKDIVDNISLLRFTNRVFEPLWNNDNIDWVEIVLSEKASIRDRGPFYDKYGALKDVVQNHMLQIVALIAMEAPVYLEGEFIRDEKARVLQQMKVSDALVGQYEGYLDEKGVANDSKTETFAAVKLEIDNKRWKGVPFYLKTGKCLKSRDTVINIQFKDARCLLTSSCPSDPNYLTIRVTPNSGFALILNVKKPGMLLEVTPVAMNFSYEAAFGHVPENSYVVLLEEVLKGEPSVSVRFDEIEYAWDVIDDIADMKLPLYTYKKGSSGPDALKDFASKHAMKWRA